MLNFVSLDECLAKLQVSQKILITTHVNPDGDAIGSSLALCHYLSAIGKQASVISISPVPENLKFLEGAADIEIFDAKIHSHLFDSSDCIAVLDLNNTARLKDIGPLVENSPALKINIDHHFSPAPFADMYHIDTDATSVGELVYKLIRLDTGHRLTSGVAECLYTAILTDTGSFRFFRTDAETHRIVADLLDAGADPVHIYDMIYNRKPFQALKLLGNMLISLELYFDGRFVVGAISEDDMQKAGARKDDTEGFVSSMLSIEGVEACVLMTENGTENEVRMSFRSRGDFDVRAAAELFGGGGHKNAAGASIKGNDIAQAKLKVTAEIKKFFN